MKLAGKNALVTGGSRGLGLAIAKKLAINGASVCLMARDAKLLQAQILPKPLDDQCHSVLIHDLLSPLPKLPSVDILVNSAGVTQTSLLHATPEDTVRSIIDTNLVGTIVMTQALIRPLMRRKGAVLNISSVLSQRPLAGTAVYAASKAGVEAFTSAMAIEMANRIRFNCLQLGLVDTDMGKMVTEQVRQTFLRATAGGKLITTEQVAEQALDLISGDSSGVIMPLDGGFLNAMK